MIVPKQQLIEIEKVLDNDIQIIEDENKHSWQGQCNNCNKTIWWNKCVRNRRTKKCMPLESEYIPDVGMSATRHKCMTSGTVNKQFFQDGKTVELKKTWCNFCDHYYDLSHWCILNNKNNSMRPQLMCIQEVKICNHSEYYDPLTNGWFRK